MAKHVYTFEELVARKREVRRTITGLRNMGYGDASRIEAKDLRNLRLEHSELVSIIHSPEYR